MTADSHRSSISAGSSPSTTSAQKRMVRYTLPANAMIGPYRIEKALGRGGMGEVYLARHVKLNIFRAIKILLPSIAEKDHIYAERFMNEARLAIDIRHQNIINVMDANQDDKYGVYYIVMEYVDGASIRKIIKAKGRFDEQSALKIVLKVSEALLAAEKMKIVHRDIKPDNIMITSDGEVKLADLGIAKSNSGNENVELTNPQMMLGTIAYISPEQASDAQSVDSRADIYSLGVTLYEMLAAEKPYTGTQVEILQQLFNAPVPNVQAKVPSITPLTAKLLKKMMAKDKNDRPRDFETLCRLIKKLIVDQDSSNTEYLLHAQEMDAQQQKIQEERKRILEERRRLSEEQNQIEEARKKISSHDRKFSEERKKVSEERERLSEEQNLIEEEKKRISDHRKKFSAERKRIEEERKRMEDERRRMFEQQRKISEKEQKISAESLRLAEERRQKRIEKTKAVISGIFHALTGMTARKVYKIMAALCLIAGAGFLGFYLYQTGVVTRSTVDEVISWAKNQLTPEEMRPKEEEEKSVIVHEKGIVRLVPLANRAVLDWLKQNNEIRVKGKGIGTVVSYLPGEISLPAGNYDLVIEIPGCTPVRKQISLGNESDARIDIPVMPVPGKISVGCNVKKFEILHKGHWIGKEVLDVPAFVPYDLIVRARGCRSSVYKNIVLYPGQSKNISIILEHSLAQPEKYHNEILKEAVRAFEEKTDKGYARALKLFKQERKKGNPFAAYYLGMMYERGLGMMFGWANASEAAKCYKFAVKHDVPEALHKIGMTYESEGAVDEAFKSFMSGVELEHLPCFKKVGEYYFNGTGVKKNLSLAYHYLLLPGNNGDAEAQLLLGKICESEELTLHNLQQAKRWYEKAVNNGNENAQIFLDQVKRTMENL